MKVFKFGGGTLKTAEAIKAMTDIVAAEQQVFVVVSAFSKMTNRFEILLDAAGTTDFEGLLSEIESDHIQLVAALFSKPTDSVSGVVKPILDSIRAIEHKLKDYSPDQAYDQLVSYGELLSTAIISAYWSAVGLKHQLISAPEIIKTDSTWKSARVDMDSTAKQLQCLMKPEQRVYLTQGFIGGQDEGLTTTLGREGSDYTAAIIGSLLLSEAVVVWKDVPGIMTADPAEFDQPGQLHEISYLEAVELSYFGAKVIHSNTIKPLQNKGIPLLVKSLYYPEESGTSIIECAQKKPDQPILIKKADQVLLSVQPRDFSFIFEDAISRIFGFLDRYRIRVNMMQHGAVSLSLVFDRDPQKLFRLSEELKNEFKVLYNTGLDLWTIRHYNDATIREITRNKKIFVQQKSRSTARFVVG